MRHLTPANARLAEVQDVHTWVLPRAPVATNSHFNPLLIDLQRKREDYHCVLLASLGFSYAVIQSRTGLSYGQIASRLRRARVKPSDYRNGLTPISTLVIGKCAQQAGRIINPCLPVTEPKALANSKHK